MMNFQPGLRFKNQQLDARDKNLRCQDLLLGASKVGHAWRTLMKSTIVNYYHLSEFAKAPSLNR